MLVLCRLQSASAPSIPHVVSLSYCWYPNNNYFSLSSILCFCGETLLCQIENSGRTKTDPNKLLMLIPMCTSCMSHYVLVHVTINCRTCQNRFAIRLKHPKPFCRKLMQVSELRWSWWQQWCNDDDDVMTMMIIIISKFKNLLTYKFAFKAWVFPP